MECTDGTQPLSDQAKRATVTHLFLTYCYTALRLCIALHLSESEVKVVCSAGSKARQRSLFVESQVVRTSALGLAVGTV